MLLVARLFQTNLASVLEGALQCAACVDAGRDEEARMQLWMVITPLLSPHKAHSELVITAPSRANLCRHQPSRSQAETQAESMTSKQECTIVTHESRQLVDCTRSRIVGAIAAKQKREDLGQKHEAD